MLRPACRRFRAELAPGDPHLRSCPACAAYAAAMERAAFKIPLPARLRSKLRAIPGATAPGPRLPLPQAPLPDPLRNRLRGLARQPAPSPLPAWVRTSRYAVAASYLMAVLVGLAGGNTAGNPVQLGRQAAGRMSQAVSERLDEGRERLEIWEDTVRERYGETRRSLEDSLGSLDHRVDELSQSLRSLEPLITRRVR
ncbi:MAG TPA: hypothetical protein VNW71_03470 [Thermoanaerobaculia bacterium]|nr:hypothetical protein [Thermoanaerobaculia bacterium]